MKRTYVKPKIEVDQMSAEVPLLGGSPNSVINPNSKGGTFHNSYYDGGGADAKGIGFFDDDDEY